MFLQQVSLSIANAIFWLLVIGGTGLTLWLLFKNVMDYLFEDIEERQEEGDEE